MRYYSLVNGLAIVSCFSYLCVQSPTAMVCFPPWEVDDMVRGTTATGGAVGLLDGGNRKVDKDGVFGDVEMSRLGGGKVREEEDLEAQAAFQVCHFSLYCLASRCLLCFNPLRCDSSLLFVLSI